MLLLCFFSCKKEHFDIQNLNGGKIGVFGHGGMGIASTYPMDTFESLMCALSIGADGTEMDVQMTRDSVLVAYHDVNLADATTKSGTINAFNWAEIQNATYTKTPYTDYALVTLDEFFAHVNNLQQYTFTFDCKLYASGGDYNKFLQIYGRALARLMDKFGLKTNVNIESQDKVFLKLMQAQNPSYKLFIYPNSFEDGLNTAEELHLYGITISTREISADQIHAAHQKGFYVAIWNTESDNDNVEGVRKNPDFIQTDKLQYLVNLIK